MKWCLGDRFPFLLPSDDNIKSKGLPQLTASAFYPLLILPFLISTTTRPPSHLRRDLTSLPKLEFYLIELQSFGSDHSLLLPGLLYSLNVFFGHDFDFSMIIFEFDLQI
ncbi:unnamed protein product [Protopolystoma xenopodis]|uniref:Uncharacterized protein n=1 Tax=Protopolystoma xenopodis TaxID=117903 RepID=A0A448WMW6_9PLAT|nr:unnamed protein product [Protopolystoma xenopodis]